MIKVKFLKEFEGYLWSFPRADHLSVGICAKNGAEFEPILRRHLENFIAKKKIPLERRAVLQPRAAVAAGANHSRAAASSGRNGPWPATPLRASTRSPARGFLRAALRRSARAGADCRPAGAIPRTACARHFRPIWSWLRSCARKLFVGIFSAARSPPEWCRC